MKNLLLSLLVFLFSCSIMAQKAHDVFSQKHHIVDSHFKTEKHHSREMAHFDDLDISLPVMSNNENVIQVDSVISLDGLYGYHKEIYSYSNNGSLSNIVQQNLEGNNWVNGHMYYYTYNTNGTLATKLFQLWLNEAWINYGLHSYVYDINGRLLNDAYQYWDDGNWLDTFLSFYDYDASGNLISLLKQRWEFGAIENYKLYSYTYDANDNMLTFIYRKWENDSWVNYTSHTYSYDDNENNIARLKKIWDYGEWVNDSLDNYTYCGNGRIVTELRYYWENDIMLNYSLYNYTYDNNGNRVSSLKQYWYDDEWVDTLKTEYVFIPMYVLALSYEWEEDDWIESNQNTFMSIIIEGKQLYSYWGLNLQFYYTEPAGIEEQDGNSGSSLIYCYPNPVSNQINIEIDPLWQSKDYLIELYNQNGQKLKTLEVSQNDVSLPQVFNVEDIPTGLYVLKVDNGKQVFTKKIIVSR